MTGQGRRLWKSSSKYVISGRVMIEAVTVFGSAVHGPDEKIVKEQYIHMPGNSEAHLFACHYFSFPLMYSPW